MLVPLALRDALLGDEPALERGQLRVRALHALRGLLELPERERVARDDAEEPLEPRGQAAVRAGVRAGALAAGDPVKELAEVPLGGGFLRVERLAGGLQVRDRAAQAGEVGGDCEGGCDVFDSACREDA